MPKFDMIVMYDGARPPDNFFQLSPDQLRAQLLLLADELIDGKIDAITVDVDAQDRIEDNIR